MHLLQGTELDNLRKIAPSQNFCFIVNIMLLYFFFENVIIFVLTVRAYEVPGVFLSALHISIHLIP